MTIRIQGFDRLRIQGLYNEIRSARANVTEIQMANKFGEAALVAARLDVPGQVSASSRWDTAVRQLYPEKPYMQKKGAPKSVFLGLCGAGLVKGIAAEAEPPTDRNVHYGLRAVEFLRAGTHRTVIALWNEVTAGEDIAHAAQMDVVLALWKNGLIVTT